MKNKELIKRKQQEFILQDTDFNDLLDKTAKEIVSKSKIAKNEAEVVFAFDTCFVPIIQDVLGLEFTPSKEESVDKIKYTSEGRKNKKGRIDSRIGSLIIEFKHNSKFTIQADIEKAIKQTEDYLDAISVDSDGQFIGIVTDGIKAIRIQKDSHSNTTTISGVVDFSQEILKLVCESVLLLNQKALSPENLVLDFCSGEPSLSKKLTVTLLNVLEQNITGRSMMLLKEWQELFKLAHDDTSKQQAIIDRKKSLEVVAGHSLTDKESEYKTLYALQTSYAIIVKVIAFHVITKTFHEHDVSFTEVANYESDALRQYMNTLEDGAIFRDFGIGNLLEGDFFAWYCTPEQWNDEIYQAIKAVFNVLVQYESRKILTQSTATLDFFKDLYMNVMPDKVRHSLGEFYTPPWLADQLIDEAEKLTETKNWTALDPCCGSGTFVTTLIRKVLQRCDNSSNTLEVVLNSVKGLDLNPLAVLTARINYFINIAHLITDEEIEIPIYLGDSSYVPAPKMLGNVSCVTYSIATLKGPLEITIPKSAIEDTNVFSKSMTDIEYFIKSLDENGVYDTLLNLCHPSDRTEEVQSTLLLLAKQFVELENQEWNGIWARIVTNFLTTANLGRFDLVVGNPPWIDWKNLPTNYRERVKSLCVERHLFSGDGITGGINLNICALISNVASENWLKHSGVLAFLMPQNIVFQQTYEGFRNFELSDGRLFLQKLIDWEKAGHPFKPVQYRFASFLYSRKTQDYQTGIVLEKYKKKSKTPSLDKLNKVASYQDIEHIFEVEELIAGTVHDGSTQLTYANNRAQLANFGKVVGTCEYKGREGIEFFPQELFLLNYQGKRGSNLIFENYQGGSKSKHKVPRQSVIVEPDFIYPLIRGREIKPFKVLSSGFYVPFPYEHLSRSPIVLNELNKKSKLLARYFQKNKSVIENQTGYNDKIIGKKHNTEYYALARVGEYSYGEHFVCFRDNTSWAAAVVSELKTAWGEQKRPLFQNHAVSISQDKDGNFISLEEAHYICAIFNSPSVKEFIERSSDSRSFKIRPPINIPPFDVKKKKHVKLAELSKKAHQLASDDSSLDEVLIDIDKIVATTL
ncbi:Eco57I restriction-modification methylase domain-containing protein [Pseudoalteromonas spongiae]|uniref:site-specific DNA-methyltransferase (adenine-specific) n=1 Tax=Pseudoalteromonas spongiae TaxID=298657 RepID=A0ABU8ETN7_9GAMM